MAHATCVERSGRLAAVADRIQDRRKCRRAVAEAVAHDLARTAEPVPMDPAVRDKFLEIARERAAAARARSAEIHQVNVGRMLRDMRSERVRTQVREWGTAIACALGAGVLFVLTVVASECMR